MAYQRAAFQVDEAALNRIWAAHGLGKIHSTDWAGKGLNNPALLINNAYVIRFDGLINEGLSRFHGEQAAYGYLRAAGIPCPQVVVLDDHKVLVPYDYMIMTKVEGTPLLDSWSLLTRSQQRAVATDAGRLLGLMHSIMLPQFGRLYGTDRVFDTWYAYIMDTFERLGQEGVTDDVLSHALYQRMYAVLVRYRPIFESVRQARLVHWDYHSGNLLQENGQITAILDFEWALGGDPIHDFNRRGQWDADCPGSRAWMYAGAAQVHPVEGDHETRVSLYEMLWYLDCVVDARDAAEASAMREWLVNRLTWLEENG